MSTLPTPSHPAPTEAQQLESALRDRLINSGEYDRLLILLKQRLDKTGWQDQVRGIAREQARGDNVKLLSLVDQVEPTAFGLIPAEVTQEMEKLMAEFVKKNVE
ncbi:BZ3500_MvSof-1268-A1-R1_Chr1-3g02459 [Microbotryum saponariae]|uniref:Transcription and mRNA export factor SUS1 n=1 Tax=Microbotryum saponariae TaxID=289078 RepID=A0A2X0MPQ3_9BASI|nr:BZ3500_MvSof-1268-A1-R1_Chr1-3g02459 [Microbotryum saponariae]SCZ96290.1 BZ3501_MvSof-1269-A2-R1_Chr1-3g02062 [Microbotryum saponariae]